MRQWLDLAGRIILSLTLFAVAFVAVVAAPFVGYYTITVLLRMLEK